MDLLASRWSYAVPPRGRPQQPPQLWHCGPFRLCARCGGDRCRHSGGLDACGRASWRGGMEGSSVLMCYLHWRLDQFRHSSRSPATGRAADGVHDGCRQHCNGVVLGRNLSDSRHAPSFGASFCSVGTIRRAMSDPVGASCGLFSTTYTNAEGSQWGVQEVAPSDDSKAHRGTPLVTTETLIFSLFVATAVIALGSALSVVTGTCSMRRFH